MFKNALFSIAALLCAASAFALQEIPIASASRTATTTFSADMINSKAGDRGIVVNTTVTSIPSAATLTVTVQGKTPQGTYYDVLSSAATAASTSTFMVLKVGQGITATTNLTANEPIPAVFRIKSVIAGSATYSIGVSRSN